MFRTWTASKSDLLISPFETKLYYPLDSSLCENLPNTEFLLVLFFPVFSPSTEKYGPEKTSYLDTFYAVVFSDGNSFTVFQKILVPTVSLLWSFQKKKH